MLVGRLFVAIHLAMAFVMLSYLACSIGLALSNISDRLGWRAAVWVVFVPLDDDVRDTNACFVHRWYERVEVLRWHLNSPLQCLQTTVSSSLKVNCPFNSGFLFVLFWRGCFSRALSSPLSILSCTLTQSLENNFTVTQRDNALSNDDTGSVTVLEADSQ